MSAVATQAQLRRRSDIALWITVVYSLVLTGDLKLFGVPLKLYFLAVTLGLWARYRWAVDPLSWSDVSGPRLIRSRLSRLPSLTVPVLIVGLVVPIGWFVVALLRHHNHDPALTHVSYAVTEASHFVYVLLFFPLLDFCRDREGWLRERIWLIPALATCLITIGILLAWAMFGLNYGEHQLGIYGGVIGAGPAGYRVDVPTQILLLPAGALAFAGLGRDGLNRRDALLLVAIWFTATASQTRGFWLGLAVVSVVCVLIYTGWPRHRTLRTAIILTGISLIAAAQFFPSSLGSAVGGGLSVADRIQQAPLLLHAAQRHLLLGSGLGATLPDGYVRSISNPWSFELTYYQLLFELGIVGLLAVLVLPATVIWRTGRTLLRGNEVNQTACVALAATIGMLAADGTNPYLVDASGMTALALVAVMTELAHNRTVGAVGVRESTPGAELATVEDTGLSYEGGLA